MTPHINASRGDIAESILLPGDPLRAKFIAESYLEDVVQFNDVRGMLGFTGRYKGAPVSVMGTGMGIPSISIYVDELIREFGVQRLIRVGTCGAMQPEVHVGDIILASGCCTDNGFLRQMFPGDFAPLADFEMLLLAYEKATARGIGTAVGLLKSSDLFYFEPAPGDEYWAKYGVLGVEMEGAALYAHAAKYGARALAMVTVSDSPFESADMTSDERETALGEMTEIALETAISC